MAQQVGFVPRYSLKSSPTLYDFFVSNKFVRWVLGPFGSGKTVVSCLEPWRRANQQEPNLQDGIRYSRWAMVRNTMPQLRATTLKTWAGIYKPGLLTPEMHESAPVHHHIKIPAKRWEPGGSLEENVANGGSPGLHMEVEFFGLDKPRDVKRLLSFEPTGAFLNECREMPKAIVDALIGRLGRYPSIKFQGVAATWAGLWGDTNPPDEEHWLHDFDYGDTPPNWQYFHQPPGVLEAKIMPGRYYQSIDKEFPKEEVYSEDFVQRVGKKYYIVNPHAENLSNLPCKNYETGENISPLHRGAYYLNLITAKSEDWVIPYAQGRYGFVQDGRPVTPQFDEFAMVKEFDPVSETPLEGGIDMGAGTFSPSMVIGQKHPFTGQYLFLDEVIVPDIALDEFSRECKFALAQSIFNGLPWDTWYGDPAGGQRDGVKGIVYFDHLRDRGIPVQPALTNDVQVRVDALCAPMIRFVPGEREPGLLIHPRCKKLIKALKGAWQYTRLQTSAEKYSDRPDKSEYSHVAEAAGYWLVSAGEGTRLSFGEGRFSKRKLITVQNNWNPIEAG